MNCCEVLHRNQQSSWTVIDVLLILYIHVYIYFLIYCIYLSHGVAPRSDITSCNHKGFAYFVTPNVAHMIINL